MQNIILYIFQSLQTCSMVDHFLGKLHALSISLGTLLAPLNAFLENALPSLGMRTATGLGSGSFLIAVILFL
jgi:hypothetical protein